MACASETALTKRAAASAASYSLNPFLPFRNANRVCVSVFLFSKLVSSFPNRKPSLRFGSLRPQAHAANFLGTDTAITNNDVLCRQLFTDRQKGRSMMTVPFLRRYVMAVFEQKKASFSPQSFPTHGKRLGRRRHVGNGFDETSRRASETTSAERIIASDASYPLSSFPPFQTANQVRGLVFGKSSGKV